MFVIPLLANCDSGPIASGERSGRFFDYASSSGDRRYFSAILVAARKEILTPTMSIVSIRNLRAANRPRRSEAVPLCARSDMARILRQLEDIGRKLEEMRQRRRPNRRPKARP
jgi:hypothetical protein